MSRRKNPSNFYSLFAVGILLLTLILGCGGSKDACVGTVTFEGKTFEGRAQNSEEAKYNACNVYCLEADSEYDARYRIWLDSPKGKAAGSPSRKEAMYKDKGLLDFVTITCANKCVQTQKVEAKCK